MSGLEGVLSSGIAPAREYVFAMGMRRRNMFWFIYVKNILDLYDKYM